MTVLRCCRLNYLQWKLQPKYLVSIVFLVMSMWNLTGGFAEYARLLGRNITPWVFPLLPGSWLDFLTLLLPYVLLVSDAPFRSGQQQFVIQRVGKVKWILGQFLFIALLSAAYALFLWVLSWIFLLPELEWSLGWGAVLRTGAKLQNYGAYSGLRLEYAIMKNLSPLAAAAWVFGMMVGVLTLMGGITVFCNLFVHQGVGTAVNMLMLLLYLVIQFQTYGKRFLLWVSPVSWMNLALVGHRNQNLPSYAFAAAATVGLCLLLESITVLQIHKSNLVVERGE